MHQRDYVLPDDVKLFVDPALTHRLILEPDLWMKVHAADEVIADIIRMVSVPVLDERFESVRRPQAASSAAP